MPEIAWSDVKDWFDPLLNGSAPDVIVPDTRLADWDVLFALIRSQGWRCEYECREGRLPLPASAAEVFVPDPEGWTRSLWVWPEPGLEWIVRLWAPEEIDSDVSLHEIQGQDQLDAFCSFLRTLGRALGKRVLMYSEGAYESYSPLIAYEVSEDRVVFLAGA